MKISIVIPAHNEEKYLGNCLESVLKEIEQFRDTGLAHRTNFEFEIIVVNNASTDQTKKVAKHYPGVILVDEPEKGLTKARQAGLKKASGDLIANIDADTMLPAGWLEKTFSEFSLNPNTVSLSGPFHYHDLKGFKKFVAEWIWKISAPPAYFFTGYMILGANFVARKRALIEIGGFDKNIDFYGEDTNLARRLSRLGKVKFSTGFFIYGSGRRLAGNGFLKTELLYGINFLWEALFKRPFTKTYTDIR